MKIDAIGSQFADFIKPIKVDNNNSGENFGNILTGFIGQVNQNQLSSNNMIKDFVQGGNIEIQDVMIAGEKAKTSLELLMEIRNKSLDMYKELTQMQI